MLHLICVICVANLYTLKHLPFHNQDKHEVFHEYALRCVSSIYPFFGRLCRKMCKDAMFWGHWDPGYALLAASFAWLVQSTLPLRSSMAYHLEKKMR